MSTAYTNSNAIIAKLGGSNWLNEALDDDGSGTPPTGLLDNIIAAVSMDIDGRLAPIYDVPFDTPPPPVAAAALVFACETLYRRRLTPGEKNPFTSEADQWRNTLLKIGNGELSLDTTNSRDFSSVVAITENVSMDANSQ